MYISFDIGGTNIKFGVVDDEGKIFEKSKIATPTEKARLLQTLTDTVATYKKKYEIIGIGVSAPGVVSKDGVMTTFGALTNMYGMPLREQLSLKTALPVAVENDANAAAIAERWTGGAQGLQNYITIVVGTGLGGGLVLNGQVYQGSHGVAGELGWPLYHGFEAAGNIERSSETFHSATVLGLLERYNQVLSTIGEHEKFTNTKTLIDLVKSSDEVATSVFDSFVKDLATNILNLFAIFDPEAVLIGGGISENPFFMKKLQKTWKKLISRHEALNRMNELGLLGEIRKAQLGNDAGLLGAAYTIKKRLEN
ncbi:ROK family protein [Lactococcus nasutitermitis]|uniref:ROK family protein n=1 Tax=Lactococcus nasutitermitis TaxID=1652957 RepID=A0ABV9JBL9_9LACT|nr:ROK family protein [Lactococcus nasutitermitis]